MKDSLHQIKEILVTEKQNGFRDGIATGLAAAERIAIWWQTNHKLKEPVSLEELSQWTKTELESLRKKLNVNHL